MNPYRTNALPADPPVCLECGMPPEHHLKHRPVLSPILYALKHRKLGTLNTGPR